MNGVLAANCQCCPYTQYSDHLGDGSFRHVPFRNRVFAPHNTVFALLYFGRFLIGTSAYELCWRVVRCFVALVLQYPRRLASVLHNQRFLCVRQERLFITPRATRWRKGAMDGRTTQRSSTKTILPHSFPLAAFKRLREVRARLCVFLLFALLRLDPRAGAASTSGTKASADPRLLPRWLF